LYNFCFLYEFVQLYATPGYDQYSGGMLLSLNVDVGSLHHATPRRVDPCTVAVQLALRPKLRPKKSLVLDVPGRGGQRLDLDSSCPCPHHDVSLGSFGSRRRVRPTCRVRLPANGFEHGCQQAGQRLDDQGGQGRHLTQPSDRRCCLARVQVQNCESRHAQLYDAAACSPPPRPLRPLPTPARARRTHSDLAVQAGWPSPARVQGVQRENRPQLSGAAQVPGRRG